MPDDLSSLGDAFRDRLAMIVSQTGGARVLAARAGLSNQTIYRYLKGEQARLGALIAITRACGVSLEWLLTGRGPRDPAAAAEAYAQGLLANLPKSPLAEVTDLAVLSAALAGAFSLLAARAEPITPEALARLLPTLYDAAFPPSKTP